MIGKRLTIILGTLLIFVALTQSSYGAEINSLGITSLTHSPEEVVTNSNLTVTITFTNSDDISQLKLLYCQIEPEFYCEITPIIMTEETENTFVGVIHVTYPAGAVLGYHIMIVYSNGTTVMIPNSLNFLGRSDVIEPVEGEYYIAVNVTSGTATKKTGSETVFGALILIAFVTLYKKLKITKKLKIS